MNAYSNKVDGIISAGLMEAVTGCFGPFGMNLFCFQLSELFFLTHLVAFHLDTLSPTLRKEIVKQNKTKTFSLCSVKN